LKLFFLTENVLFRSIIKAYLRLIYSQMDHLSFWKKGILRLFLVYNCSFSSSAQKISEYPVSYFSINLNQVLNNPAPILPIGRGVLNVLYQGRKGQFSDVNAMFFNGIICVNEKHLIGGFVMTENESEFLHKTRYYASYGIKIPISQTVNLITGMMFGVASYQFNASGNGAGGSDTKADGSLGISLESKKINIGVQVFQIPQSQLKPLIYNYVLRRYIVALGRYNQKLSDYFNLIYLLETRWYQDRNNIGKASIVIEGYKKLNVGIQADNVGNVTVYGGIQFQLNEKTLFLLNFNYIMLNLMNKKGYRLDIDEVSSGLNY
jgi:hypothetical protein